MCEGDFNYIKYKEQMKKPNINYTKNINKN